METREKHSRKNPSETANFLSLLFFGWTAPIFWKGSRRDLNLTDLYSPLKSDESDRLGDRLEREWTRELTRANKTERVGHMNLMWAIIRMFWAPYMVQGLLLFVHNMVLHIIQPVLQGWIISYFNPGQDLVTRNQVLLYAGALVLLRLAVILINHHTILRTSQIGMCIRVACCSMIYRKILRLDQSAVNNTAAGQVANLISNDVARFDEVPQFLHYIWIMPMQVSLVGYMMWKSVGVAAIAGIGSILLQTIPVQGYLSTLGAKLRAEIASKTDARVQLMSELLTGIEVVKMYSWEKPFELMVSKVRNLEMKFIGYMSYLKGFDRSMMIFPEKINLFVTLVTFVLTGNVLTAETLYILVGLFFVLQETCNIFFPLAIIMASEASVSLKRVTEFLLLEEVEPSGKVESRAGNGLHDLKTVETRRQIERQVGIELIKVTANWVQDQLSPTLCEVSIKVKNHSLCALAGPVGSGKSSLLHLVLGELPVQNGRLSFFTDEADRTHLTSRDIRISYASQDPWLFSATIRNNILFGLPYDEKRYQEVTRVCALLEDFEQLPQGDLTFVGERGAALSGGQKARVNLARAVYRDAEVYLLDDPLSAVDPRVGRHLFEECITGFLKDKTRILVTHHLQYLRQADTVVLLNRGTVECQGTYDELVKGKFHISDSMVPEDSEKVGYTEPSLDDESELEDTASTTTNGSNQERKIAESQDVPSDMTDEEMATGNVSTEVYRDYLLAGGNACSLACLAAVFIAGQIATSGTDYWLTHWTNQETLKAAFRLNKSTTDASNYRNYTEDIRPKSNFTESKWFDENGLMSQNLEIYMYVICLVGCFCLVILRSMLFMRMCMKASRKLHDSMFTNLMQTTMRFFNINPSGRILNRFTKDMGSMDEYLPRNMLETLQILVLVFGILTLVILANHWMILPAVVMCGFLYIVRTYYLKTAQDVKRLEGIAKSPMFSHASSTLEGLTTIRSRGPLAQALLRREFDRHQDWHTGAWYLALATSTAFGFILDLFSCLFIAIVCFSFILMDAGDTLGGFVGLAISQSLILTGTVQHGLRQSTELISQMTSVERILQYTKLPKEGPFVTDDPPPPTWPSKGGLIFKDLSMKYADHKPPVLKNLNLTINPGWKIGIVGRTGAGKSSLISALFRLTGDGLEGEIVLDGIDTKSIGLHELRPRISIIPQDPVLFSASLRYNLDPFERYSDAELWDSLREVELGNVVPSLDFQVAGGGVNFSVGQRQLICLARAILRKNRILVLDEATANVDHDTDALIQKTIRRRFADCTVLTIAHRLNTIMDSDRVLVMMDGRIVEFGRPHLLLRNDDGPFSQMLRHTGNASAVKLAEIAKSSFLLSSEFGKELLTEPPSPSPTDHITHL